MKAGYFEISVNPQAFFRRDNYTLTDDIHFLMGRHNIDAGFHGEVSKVDVNNLFEQPGQFNFASAANAANGDTMADFLFGSLYQLNQASGQFFNPRGKFIGAYVQDSWKATRNLTLDYGVRYEPFKPWHELQGRMGSFFPALWASNTHSTMYPNAPSGMQFAGDPGFNPQRRQLCLQPLHAQARLCLGCLRQRQNQHTRRRRPVLRQPYQQHPVQHLLQPGAVHYVHST